MRDLLLVWGSFAIKTLGFVEATIPLPAPVYITQVRKLAKACASMNVKLLRASQGMLALFTLPGGVATVQPCQFSPA